ncbi:PEP/pyruvate-binding domain-containing protein [Enhygromyxa salina]|uniref:Phosphoenolpyruvate synthase n=1 Tax=Enhygromyxa salina TaxID=215803 RepID=A0A2S9YSX7_9BACT|nr:PEP/pyruvate-binding domain-containing protein [Enhygromyxa salina]PRQ08207.1 phosphoenolpyruvate synthase [Enhygromyxa salina]
MLDARAMARPPLSAAPAWLLAMILMVIVIISISGCPTTAPEWPEDDGFDDHTFARIDDRAHFDAHAAIGVTGAAALKFVILDFGEPKTQQIRYLDARFYEFHDQWYWFRLLNGVPVPGSRERPVSGHAFATVEEIVDWVQTDKTTPPLGMRMIDGRLYSDHFYEISIRRERRVLGIGTIVHTPARTGEHPRDELWGFELEYSDAVDRPALELFFATLRGSLPAEIADNLRYIARSPSQEQLVAQLQSRDHPLAKQLTSYAELAIPGEIEVYNPGLIAGRLRKLPSDPQQAAKVLTEGNAGVIWMMGSVPDELPAAAGLLTAVPQTPLAHVNLLARNRGIPNAYIGGLLEDAHLDQLSRVHAPVVLLAQPDGELTLEPITEADYARWRGLARQRQPTLSRVDPSTLPYALDLDREVASRVPELRGIIGGKAAGFVVLRAAGATMPDRPLAITTRAYAEHLAPLRPLIADVLGDPGFTNDPRVRYLLLEGREAFDQRFASDADQTWAKQLAAAHPPNKAKRDAIANLLVRDGIKRAIRDQPLSADVHAELEAALRAHFGSFAANQGLRFRSSSTVEDVEGFSGAGLYDSNTGFLQADAQADESDRKKTVAWAMQKTWASYWSWEAFEERELAGIDHLAGDMAVLVHARFEDHLELSNGVLTFTLDLSADRGGAQQAAPGPRASMEVDVQRGALSVTNPPPEHVGELPEVDRVVWRGADQHPQIERVQRAGKPSEVSASDAYVLDDAALAGLFDESLAIAARWIEIENQSLPRPRARGRVTLDIEFRELDAGWPALASGSRSAPRMIIKQVRSLDPGVPAGAEQLLTQPVPRDLLLFADRIEKRSCRGPHTHVDLLELWTDPMTPSLGYARSPFLARVRLQAHGLAGGLRQFDLDHLDYAAVTHPNMELGAPWSVELVLDGGVANTEGVGLDRLEARDGLLRVLFGGKLLSEEAAPCGVEVLYASPDGFLRSLIRR